MTEQLIDIGTIVRGGPLEARPLKVFYDSPELYPHVGKPWIEQQLLKRHGIGLRAQPSPSGRLRLKSDLFKRSCLIAGAPGGGKTRAAILVVRALLAHGYSVVVLDVQQKTLAAAVDSARQAGLSSDRITVLGPNQGSAWTLDPFNLPSEDVMSFSNAFTDMVRDVSLSFGVRQDDILRCGCAVTAAQRLNLHSLVELIRNPTERSRILANARHSGAWTRFPEQHEYFDKEFRGDRSEVAPILNKIRKLLTNDYLRSLFIGPGAKFEFSSLLHEKRMLAVHLDGSLGDDGNRILSGLITDTLFRTVMRESGSHPIVILTDELGLQGEFTGQAITKILAGCRQRDLHVVACCQNLWQLSPGLRTALLSTAVRVWFRLEASDAAIAAASLAQGSDALIERMSLSATKDFETTSYRVVDGNGRELRIASAQWPHVVRYGCDRVSMLKILAACAGVGRLYAALPGGERVELSRLLKGLPEDTYSFAGPAPLRLYIHFPRPKVSILASKSPAQRQADLATALQSLPVQHAIVRLDTGDGYLVKIDPVEMSDVLGVPDLPGVAPSTVAPEIAGELAISTSPTSQQPVVEVDQEVDDGNL